MQEILSKKILGERIRLLRVENSYPQTFVAEFLKLSRSNYSQIELGHQYPTYHTLNMLSKHYNKSFEWFLHGEEEHHSSSTLINSTFVTAIDELEKKLSNFSASLSLLEKELQHIKATITSA